MTNDEVVLLKNQMEEIRQEINTYIEYPDIFKDELVNASQKIDRLINKYIQLTNGSSE